MKLPRVLILLQNLTRKFLAFSGPYLSRLQPFAWPIITLIAAGILHLLSPDKDQSIKSNQTQLESDSAIDKSVAVDTYIPAGYVLVPIELINADSISGLIGNIGGYVNLFPLTDHPNEKPKELSYLSNIKLLRAPHNPDLYAALIPDKNLAKFMQFEKGFMAVILNPTHQSKKIKSLNFEDRLEDSPSEIFQKKEGFNEKQMKAHELEVTYGS